MGPSCNQYLCLCGLPSHSLCTFGGCFLFYFCRFSPKTNFGAYFHFSEFSHDHTAHNTNDGGPDALGKQLLPSILELDRTGCAYIVLLLLLTIQRRHTTHTVEHELMSKS